MASDWLDSDGYPTEDALDRIGTWPAKDGWQRLMAFVKDLWNYADIGFWTEEETDDEFREDKATRYRLATGGWSGNEEIVTALRCNTIFHMMHWWGSLRGGLHIYLVRREVE